MTLLIIFLVVAAALQIGIFLYGRKLRQKWKADDVLSKYDIKSRSDLFAALNRRDIPKEDLAKLNSIYNQEE